MTTPHLRHDDLGPPDEVRAFIHDLFEAHYAELCRFAYRCIKSRALAEELVQDVFLRVWKQEGLAGTDRERVTRAYLYRAVRNHVLDHLKHRRVEEGWEARVCDGGTVMVPPSDRQLDASELARAARRAVDELPERCRLVFMLRREQGLSYEEIAETIGVSAKTVENHMGRALRLLKAKLAPFLSVGAVLVSAAEALRIVR